jgi:rhodanese-related sulfurtransferase
MTSITVAESPQPQFQANPVIATPAADPSIAAAHFSARLGFETDPDDVAAALARDGAPGFVILDARSREAFEAGHVPGAINLERPFRREDLEALGDRLIVTYCWGPGCNGAVKAAAELAAHGHRVKEMLGGFEYWVREGHPIEGHDDQLAEATDRHGLVKVRGSISCLC